MHYIKPGGLKNTTSWVNLLRESLNIWINYLIYQLTLVWSNYSLPGPKGYWFNYKFLTFLSSNFKEWQAQLDLNTEISLMSCSNIWNGCVNQLISQVGPPGGWKVVVLVSMSS